MGLFDKFKTTKTLPPLNVEREDTFMSINEIDSIIRGFGKNINEIDTNTKFGQYSAYKYCPAVSSIIDKRANYVNNGLLFVNDENLTVKNHVKLDVFNLLKAPSILQSYTEFERQISIYKDIFGYCPIFLIYENETSKVPYAMYPINPLNFEYKLTGMSWSVTRLSEYVESVRFKISNNDRRQIELKGKEIERQLYILKGRGDSGDDMYLHESSLVGCSSIVNNFNISFDAYGTLIDRSLVGIISNATNDPTINTNTQEEIEIVQERLKERYGSTKLKNNMIVSNANLRFQSMLTNIGNLQIPENIRLAVNQICDKLGFAPELLSDKMGTYENKRSAEIQHYQNETIPDSTEIANFLTEITGEKITKDFSHIAVLQESKKEKIESFNQLISSLTSAVEAGLIDKNEAVKILETYKPQ